MFNAPDFPFYNGKPRAISLAGWALILAATALAFAVLVWPIPALANFPLNFIQTIIFTGLPLVALALVAGPDWRALFQRYGFKQFGLSVGFAVLTVVTSFVVAAILSRFMNFSANPSAGEISAEGPLAFAEFLARTAIQLPGEEIVTILPLLAVLWFCVARLHLSRRIGIVIAVLVSTIWFSAMHLPTYQWNYVQCFGIIGSARIVLTLSYLLTRNLWVSAGAHILNDWSMFVLTFVGAHGPIEGGT